jgi:hypothetical protein
MFTRRSFMRIVIAEPALHFPAYRSRHVYWTRPLYVTLIEGRGGRCCSNRCHYDGFTYRLEPEGLHPAMSPPPSHTATALRSQYSNRFLRLSWFLSLEVRIRPHSGSTVRQCSLCAPHFVTFSLTVSLNSKIQNFVTKVHQYKDWLSAHYP